MEATFASSLTSTQLVPPACPRMAAASLRHRAPSPRISAVGSQSPSRRSPRPTLNALPPVPPPSKLMEQLASTPTSPYASMEVPGFSFFQRQEAVELSQFNQRHYQSLAGSTGFDTVVLKQRESDKISLSKMNSAESQRLAPVEFPTNQCVLSALRLQPPTTIVLTRSYPYALAGRDRSINVAFLPLSEPPRIKDGQQTCAQSPQRSRPILLHGPVRGSSSSNIPVNNPVNTFSHRVRPRSMSPKIKLSRRFRNVFASLPTVRTPFAALRRHHIMSETKRLG